ncbi:unnamed protein product [Ilex paraguariensis]|uniref:Uncharacterized protein n=1 Tax=Ilex paraguariensis TaxID=185542 RepID=A0ABC8S0Y7_9AQUA
MASSEKRCLYEVLGLSLDCTADDIRLAYKKLALQRHPDKLIQSGVSEAEATASFQELVNAYEVLSDSRERAWYDSHRSQILFSSSAPSNSAPSNSSAVVPNLFSFFSNSVFSGYSDSGKGFYQVYADIFDKVYQNELNFAKKLGLGLPEEAPVMGSLKSPYAQVTAFYNYWLGFVTVMDFCWMDQYNVMAGPNRKSRRVMEEENKKLRKKARREYNETVRDLAAFVRKRDKRVIDLQMKKKEEMEKKREEERERKRCLERERAERAKAYEDPEWAQVEELDDGEVEEVEEDERKKGDGKELYCVACGKRFKSEKQWKNHEQSKKHKEKVAELREAFVNEESENDEEEEEERDKEEVAGDDADAGGFMSAEDGVDELQEKFEDWVKIEEQESVSDEGQSSEEEGFLDTNNDGGFKGVGQKLGMNEDEASILESMVSRHKNGKNMGMTREPKASSTKVHVDVDKDENDFMEYNNRKGNKRNRGGRREKGRRADEAVRRVDVTEINCKAEENNGHHDGSHEESSLFSSIAEKETIGEGDDMSERNQKVTKKAVDKKANTKKDTNTKSKNASKGRKQKVTSKFSGNVCETCGEEFETRNRLHKHLGDTGHAALKSR